MSKYNFVLNFDGYSSASFICIYNEISIGGFQFSFDNDNDKKGIIKALNKFKKSIIKNEQKCISKWLIGNTSFSLSKNNNTISFIADTKDYNTTCLVLPHQEKNETINDINKMLHVLNLDEDDDYFNNSNDLFQDMIDLFNENENNSESDV